jgi:hypothetical protein
MDHKGLRHVLDSGIDPLDPSALAETYIRSWWTLQEEPPNTGYLTYDILHEAVDHHRSVLDRKDTFQSKIIKKHDWSRALSHDPDGLLLKCQNCRLYRGVAVRVLDSLHDLRNQAHAMEEASKFRGNTSERRAAGFFQLYDAVSEKEMSTKSTKTFTSKTKLNKAQKISYAQIHAAAELDRLQKLPSLKWTWGTELTSEEVIELGRPAPRTVPREHSDYNFSLPLGRVRTDSNEPDSPPASQLVSHLADDIREIPDLSSIDIPTHFSRYPLRQEHSAPPSEKLQLVSESAVTNNTGELPAAPIPWNSTNISFSGNISDIFTVYQIPVSMLFVQLLMRTPICRQIMRIQERWHPP